MPEKRYTSMLVVLYVTAFIATLNSNIVNVGLSSIMAEFAIDANTANWLVTGYMVVNAVVVTCVAFLLKRVKLRTLFFAAAFIFIVGCITAFFAPTFPSLLACRLLQAVGAGVFIPIMMNTLLAVVPRKKLGVYMSIGSCCMTFGPAFGPVVSGLMITYFGWRAMFIAPMVVMGIGLVLGFFFIKNYSETERVKLDAVSVVLSALGLTALVYGLSQIMSNLPIALAAMAVGVVILAGFALRQTMVTNPLLNLRPLKNSSFVFACILVIISMMTTFSMNVLLPLYFVGAVGATALVAGALTLIPILTQAGTAVAGGRIMDKWGEWPLLPLGFLLTTIGQIAVCISSSTFNPILVIISAAIVFSGIGFVFSPSQTAGLRKLDPSMNASGVSIMSVFIQVAAALGPSLFVGVLSSTASGCVAEGMAENLAQAEGFADAIMVAGVIAGIGFIVAFIYAFRVRNTAKDSLVEVVTPDHSERHMPLVGEMMKTHVYSVKENETVYEAAKIMLEQHTSGLPVIGKDSGTVVGFISDNDIMKSLSEQKTLYDLSYAFMAYMEDRVFDDQLKTVMQSRVIDLATTRVISVDADATVQKACTLLSERKIKKMPVLREGKLVGTISRHDVTRMLLENYVEEVEGNNLVETQSI